MSARLKDFKKYLEGDMPGGCQHPVTGCVVAGTVDMKKVGWEGVRGVEGNHVEHESVWRLEGGVEGWG